MGVLDSIKVRKDSYPVRRPYRVFYQRYEGMHPIYSKKSFEYWLQKKADFQIMSTQ